MRNSGTAPSATTGPDVRQLPDELDPAVVGALVKAVRKSRHLSMTELARRSGVSQPFISQVERGQFTPSLATLYRLAGALSVSVSALLPVEQSSDTSVVRAGHGPIIPIVEALPLAVGRLVSRGGASQLEAYTYELAPGSTDETRFAHPGEEFTFILSGTLVIEVEPDPAVTLYAGDCIHFGAGRAHVWTVPGPEPVRMLLVLSHPGHHDNPSM
jgi:transcriptional regulator with XRE-family HTH domain